MNNSFAVFIAGCGRSGTTFLRFVLTSNKEIFIPNESGFIIDYLKYGNAVPPGILQKLLFGEPLLRLWYKDDRFLKDQMGRTIRRLHEIEASRFGCRIWGQKTPKFVRYIDLMNAHLGPIKWLLIYRDPRAVVSSMLRSERHTYSIGRAVKRWRKDNRILIDLMRAGGGDDIIFVKYEDLVMNFDRESKKIFDYLGTREVTVQDLEERGEPEEYLDGSKLKNITVDKTFVPDIESLDKWKQNLSQEQIIYIENKCRNEMAYMNYEQLFPGSKTSWTMFCRSIFANPLFIRVIFVFVRRWPYLLMHTAYRKMVLFFYYYANKIG